jgi:hypothetical protein
VVQYLQIADDIDGSPDAVTVKFGYGGKQYAIDLGPVNASQLDDEMTFWVEHARPVDRMPKTVTRQSVMDTQSGHDTSHTDEWWTGPEQRELRTRMRNWGQRHGWPSIGVRGRIPRELANAWQAKHRMSDPPGQADDDDGDDESADTVADTPGTEPLFTDTPKRAHRRAVRVS